MRVDTANYIENKINTGINTAVSAESKTTRSENIYVNSTNSGKLSATGVAKNLFSSAGSIEEINDIVDNLDANTLKKQMDMLSNTLTADDYEAMGDEGYSVIDMDTETIVTVLDRIKIKLAEAGVDISDMGNLSSSVIKASGASESEISDIEAALSGSNAPLTEENISDAEDALDMAKKLQPLSDSAIKYMLENGMNATIANLYKAEYSAAGSYDAAGSESIFETISSQAADIVAQSGLGNSNGMEMAKWLVDNELPLTTENLAMLDSLKSLELPAEQCQVITQIAEAVSEGKRPQEADLSNKQSAIERAKTANEIINEATDEDVEVIVTNSRLLTIENLQEAMSGRRQSESENPEQQVIITGAADRDDGTLITAKRKLEETRLVMTVNANYSLIKRGITIETKELEDLVEDLKSAEKEYYSGLLSSADVTPTDENIELYKDTRDAIEEVKLLPSFAIGSRNFDQTTILTLKEDGLNIKQSLLGEDTSQVNTAAFSERFSDQMKQANERYETIMTAPRKDLGDNIQKAFRNVDEILRDMNLEINSSNERAVRILGYNSLEITTENINAMKLADSQVQTLLRECTPSVTLHMIREGINPLETNISTLNEQIAEIKKENGYDNNEQMAEFLWQLDQQKAISDEERAEYIGVYRLLDKVARSDGAVVGALVYQGADLTMKNLLMSVRNKKATGMDITVDSSFGLLEQNNAAEALSILDSGKMKQLCERKDFPDMTIEQVKDSLREMDDTEYDASYSEEEYEEFTKALSAEDEVLQLLSVNEMSSNYYQVMAVSNMMTNRNKLYRDLLGTNDEDGRDWNTEIEEIKQQIIQDMSDAMKSPADMAKAQQELAETAEHVMDGFMPADNDVTRLDIRNLQLMRAQLQVNSALAKKEQYAIPVLVEDEMATVHLQIVRGEDEKGKVNIVFETDALGQVAAEITDVGNRIEAMIVADNQETLDKFAEIDTDIKAQLSVNDKEVELHLVNEKELDITAFEMKDKTREIISNSIQSEDKDGSGIQTTQLYGMAKGFLRIMIKLGKSVN